MFVQGLVIACLATILAMVFLLLVPEGARSRKVAAPVAALVGAALVVGSLIFIS